MGFVYFFLPILLIVIIVVLFKYIYLIVKRFQLIRKISKQIKKHNGIMKYCRNPLASIFKRDGKADISLILCEKTIDVTIITTPFRRVRYHFDINNKLLELIIERKSVYMTNIRAANPSATMDRVYTVRKYEIHFDVLKNENPKYIILHPSPKSISKAEGAKLVALYNNDELISGVKVCGLKWFVENVLNE